MGVELVPTPKAPKYRSLAIRLIAKVSSTAHAPIWSQRPRAQNAEQGVQPLLALAKPNKQSGEIIVSGICAYFKE